MSLWTQPPYSSLLPDWYTKIIQSLMVRKYILYIMAHLPLFFSRSDFLPISLLMSEASVQPVLLASPHLSFLLSGRILARQPRFFASLIFFAALLSARLEFRETPTATGFECCQEEGGSTEVALWMVSKRFTDGRRELGDGIDARLLLVVLRLVRRVGGGYEFCFCE